MKPNVILVRYGEIALKSKFTRTSFEKTLVRNIKNAFEYKKIKVNILRIQGRILVETESIDEALEIINHIFGITSISPAFQFELDIDKISKNTLALISENIKEGESFALRVNRSGNHSFTSQDIAVEVGSFVQNEKNYPVNLDKPNFEVFIEIRDQKAYIFKEKIKAPGGMPLGTQGTILSIIQSPKDLLASWYLMKRGCKIIFLFKNEALKIKANHFFSTWIIQSNKLSFISKKDIIKEALEIIEKYNCLAICSGETLAEDNEKNIKQIYHLKQKFPLPVLNPLISFSLNEIESNCLEKGIEI